MKNNTSALVLNKIATVQALERRTGGVFYMNVKYGQAKGSVASGDVMMSAKTGHNQTVGGRRYASVRVQGETLGAVGRTNYVGTLAYAPVTVGTVVVTDGVETFTDDGEGNLVSDLTGGTDGTITYTDGTYGVNFATTTTTAPTVTYKYNYETKTTNAVPEVNIEVTQETVTAEDFPLRANYTLAAAIDLEKAHGINLEDEIVKYLGGIKFNFATNAQECVFN